ncbi:MAG TPA: hypothetical protein VKR81_07000 [Candidatus Binatia bacterium]|nr:hypothetical protein [Candidatus Binatia bacterium]
MERKFNWLSSVYYRAVGIHLNRLLLGCALLFPSACSSAAAPLSITMYNAETNQTLTCAARDQLGRADTAMLAGAVESCAKQLEARGFVRQN